jgi:hypothetical protein
LFAKNRSRGLGEQLMPDDFFRPCVFHICGKLQRQISQNLSAIENPKGFTMQKHTCRYFSSLSDFFETHFSTNTL